MWNFVPLEKDNFSLGSLLSTLQLLSLGFPVTQGSGRDLRKWGCGAGGAGQELVSNGYKQVLGNTNILEMMAMFKLLRACS